MVTLSDTYDQSIDIHELCDQITRAGVLGGDEVLALRRRFYADGHISYEEADRLFSLNDSDCQQSDHWNIFFIEAVMDFTVFQMKPTGYVSQETANWLISKVMADGKLRSETELKLLVRVFERAVYVPDSLIAFALDQVKLIVISGDNDVIGGDHIPGQVDQSEVDILRKILFAGSGSGNNAVSRIEAEILFDIEELTVDGNNHPAWTDLFAKAIGNCVLAASNYTPPSREEALAQSEWLENTDSAGFMKQLFSDIGKGKWLSKAFGNFGGIESEFNRQRSEKNDEFDRLNEDAQELDLEEVKWITDRLLRDGQITETEKALLEFLKKEASHLHPSFAKLLDL